MNLVLVERSLLTTDIFWVIVYCWTIVTPNHLPLLFILLFSGWRTSIRRRTPSHSLAIHITQKVNRDGYFPSITTKRRYKTVSKLNRKTNNIYTVQKRENENAEEIQFKCSHCKYILSAKSDKVVSISQDVSN